MVIFDQKLSKNNAFLVDFWSKTTVVSSLNLIKFNKTPEVFHSNKRTKISTNEVSRKIHYPTLQHILFILFDQVLLWFDPKVYPSVDLRITLQIFTIMVEVLPVSFFLLFFDWPFGIILICRKNKLQSKRQLDYGKWDTGETCNFDSQNVCSVQCSSMLYFALLS